MSLSEVIVANPKDRISLLYVMENPRCGIYLTHLAQLGDNVDINSQLISHLERSLPPLYAPKRGHQKRRAYNFSLGTRRT